MTYEEAWKLLATMAMAFAKDNNRQSAQALADAAYEFSKLRAHKDAASMPNEMVAPFGKNKGQPLSACTRADLAWLAGAVQKSIDNPEKARWRDSNEALLEAIQEELMKKGAA